MLSYRGLRDLSIQSFRTSDGPVWCILCKWVSACVVDGACHPKPLTDSCLLLSSANVLVVNTGNWSPIRLPRHRRRHINMGDCSKANRDCRHSCRSVEEIPETRWAARVCQSPTKWRPGCWQHACHWSNREKKLHEGVCSKFIISRTPKHYGPKGVRAQELFFISKSGLRSGAAWTIFKEPEYPLSAQTCRNAAWRKGPVTLPLRRMWEFSPYLPRSCLFSVIRFPSQQSSN